ncbi:MAG: hypothetical protein AB1894_10050 [Chloroflexota bacterium]
MDKDKQIILTDGSRLLSEMLQRVIDKADGLQVASIVHDLYQLDKVIEQTQADWIILSLAPGDVIPELVDQIIRKRPVRFLAVAYDGSQIKMRWLETHEKSLNNLSLDDLISVLQN